MWQETLIISSVFIASLGNLGAAIYVYKKEPRQQINRLFCFLGLTLFLWSGLVFLVIFFGSWFFTYLGATGIWLIAIFIVLCAVFISRSFFKKIKSLEEAKAALEMEVKAQPKEIERLAAELDQKVQERTKKLQERIEELERFHELTVGRELKMKELKKEIEKLKKELKKAG